MDCPLCNAENKAGALRCHICDTPLRELVGEQKQAKVQSSLFKNFFLQKKELFNFLSPSLLLCSILAILLLFFSAGIFWELFQEKEEVRSSRIQYFSYKEKYLREASRWQTKKNEVMKAMVLHQLNSEIEKKALTFQGIPYEIFMAFLDEDLLFFEKPFQDSALFPLLSMKNSQEENQKGHVFALSKKEMSLWPFNIFLSLQVHIEMREGRLWVEPLSLWRGAKQMPLELLWAYFADELSALRSLETYSGGIQDVHVYTRKDDLLEDSIEGEASLKEEENSSLDQEKLMLSWKYFHRNLGKKFY